MTETEWLACEDPARMLTFLVQSQAQPVRPGSPITGPLSDRKLRLWVEACRAQGGQKDRAWGDYDLDTPSGLDAACDRWSRCEAPSVLPADPMPGRAALLRDIAGNPWRPVKVNEPVRCRRGHDYVPVKKDSFPALLSVCPRCNEEGPLWQDVQKGRPPSWLTPTVVGMAGRIYDDRDFDALPMLADLLEEAGCPAEESEDAVVDCPDCDGAGEVYGNYFAEDGLETCERCDGIGSVTANVARPSPLLAHLRSPGPHVRGCWALDCVLGRE